MGTPDFAVTVLRGLLAAGHEIVCAVTQPDRKSGRGHKLQYPPVKEEAIKHDIPVYQPVDIRDPAAFAILSDYKADAAVVAAFGQILPETILNMPRYGCLNVHASLLPEYRGAAPIQWAILDGCSVTGVTIMQMDEGLDTGDILAKAEVIIDARDTGGTLHDKLATAGARLLTQTLDEAEAGMLRPEKQGDTTTHYAKMLTKEMGRIVWQESAGDIERRIRGLSPWPGAYTQVNDRTLKIWKATVVETPEEAINTRPGEIVSLSGGKLVVKTGRDCLSLEEVQLEGKKRMDITAFLLGIHKNSLKLL